MELIDKQIAIETILGQPPELHYPSWYAAQIEKLPPAPPEYLAEQAGILVADSDTISRQAAIEALTEYGNGRAVYIAVQEAVRRIDQLPPARPERIKGHWIKISPANIYECSECGKNVMTDDICAYDFCHGCGAKMESEVTE